MGRNAQVCAPIIQFVAIDVIGHVSRCWLENEPVHIYALVINCRLNISITVNIPVVCHETIIVFWADNGILIATKGNVLDLAAF